MREEEFVPGEGMNTGSRWFLSFPDTPWNMLEYTMNEIDPVTKRSERIFLAEAKGEKSNDHT